MWEAIRYVTTGLTLVAFVAALAVWLMKSRSDSLVTLIRTAKPADRERLIKVALEGAVDVNTEGLSEARRERIALELIEARSRRLRQNGVVMCFIAVLVAGVAALSIWQTRPPATTVAKEHLRLMLRSVTFGIKDGDPYAVALLTLSNIGDQGMFVESLRLGVIATAMADASTMNFWFEPVKNVPLAKGAVQPIEVMNAPVGPWVQMGKPSPLKPDFGTYAFTFVVQIRATISASGQTVLLDFEMPRPRFMTCGHPCVAVYDLTLPFGSSPYKKCTAAPSETGWTLDCVTKEST